MALKIDLVDVCTTERDRAEAVRDGNAPPITGTDGIRALEIDAAISISAEEQTTVKIEHY